MFNLNIKKYIYIATQKQTKPSSNLLACLSLFLLKILFIVVLLGVDLNFFRQLYLGIRSYLLMFHMLDTVTKLKVHGVSVHRPPFMEKLTPSLERWWWLRGQMELRGRQKIGKTAGQSCSPRLFRDHFR
jgi:hypothetical protein